MFIHTKMFIFFEGNLNRGSLRIFSFIFTLFALVGSLTAKVESIDFYEKLSISEKKPLMIFFLGTGWCHWCDEMKQQILTKRDFITNVEHDFILVTVDFPRGVTTKKNAQDLKRRFAISRYPTVVIWDPKNEKLFKETGYRDIGPKNYAYRLKDKFFEKKLESNAAAGGVSKEVLAQANPVIDTKIPKPSEKISESKQNPRTRQPGRYAKRVPSNPIEAGSLKPDLETNKNNTIAANPDLDAKLPRRSLKNSGQKHNTKVRQQGRSARGNSINPTDLLDQKPQTELNPSQKGKSALESKVSRRSAKISARRQKSKMRQHNPSIKAETTDHFDLDSTKPEFEWIASGKPKRKTELKIPKETNVKKVYPKARRNAKKAVRVRHSKRSLKKLINPFIKVGFGGKWWMPKS